MLNFLLFGQNDPRTKRAEEILRVCGFFLEIDAFCTEQSNFPKRNGRHGIKFLDLCRSPLGETLKRRKKEKKKWRNNHEEAAFLVSLLEGEYPLACLVLKLVGEREELPCIIENSKTSRPEANSIGTNRERMKRWRRREMTNGKGRNNDCESGENWKEPVRVNGINVI